jgi:hypothetical protein
MIPADFDYANLTGTLSKYTKKGWPESAAFLNWFLENVFRLEDTEAHDAICDKPNDKGIDGVYVDHTLETIFFFQSKIRQGEGPRFGDAPLRAFAGTLLQVDAAEKIEAMLHGGGNPELKRVLSKYNVKNLLEKDYRVSGVYVTNEILDANGAEYLRIGDASNRISVYDRIRISDELIDTDAPPGIDGEFSFDVSYVSPMKFQVGKAATSYVFPAMAVELAHLAGIADGTLFSQNVRFSLGNTPVNKQISKSISEKDQHILFPLYHNGVTILCRKAELSDNKLSITNYMVVNGAQSITSFYNNKQFLTPDLRVLAKVIELSDQDLANTITINSNNQNAIKPRDLRSNHHIQVRLREEFEKIGYDGYVFEVKRGQSIAEGKRVISNEEAGRLLLAFDLEEPWSCHQIYKVFDDKYGEIFGRPSVNAYRVILLSKLMDIIVGESENIKLKPFGHYGLTRFFLLATMKRIMKADDEGRKISDSPAELVKNPERFEKFLKIARSILSGIIVDLNYEVAALGDEFDYKSDLKSPAKVKEYMDLLMKSYEKDVAREKAPRLGDMMK